MMTIEQIEIMRLEAGEKIKVNCYSGGDQATLTYFGRYCGVLTETTKKFGERGWLEVDCEEIQYTGLSRRTEKSKQHISLEWITQIDRLTENQNSTKLKEVK